MKEKMTPGQQNADHTKKQPEIADCLPTLPDQSTTTEEGIQLPYPVTSETITNFYRWGAIAFRIPPLRDK